MLVLNGGLMQGFSLRRLPGHPVTAGWLAPLLRVNVECDVALHLGPASLGDALSSLGRTLRDFSAHRLVESERGVVADVHVDIGLDSAFELRGRLARNLGRPLHLSVTAVVRAPSLESLRQRGDLVRLGFQSALIACEPTHFRHLAAFVTSLPLGVDRLRAVKLVDSAAASLCFPWVDSACDEDEGYRIGATLRSGAPVSIAPFDAMHHANANIAVLAASGHGKSFALGSIVLEAAQHGVDCIIVDPEGEYVRVVEALGGAYLTLAPGTGSAINIFDCVGGDEESIHALIELVSVMCGGLSEMESALVDRSGREAQRIAAEEHRSPLLHDCLRGLEREAPRVATIVRRHCNGALASLYDAPTTLRLDRRVMGISMRDTPPDQVAASTLIVARWLWRLVRTSPRRRHIVFDEVGALCAHPPLRTLLVQLARRCRKYSASLVVATQNAQDLLSSDEGAVVATNCATVLLGGHRAAETARMEAAFGLTEPQRHFLEAAARGEFLLITGERRLTMRVEMPPEHRAILTSHNPLTA